MLSNLMATRLPMNRKERYFTGTVLPALICANGFENLDVLLNLLGVTPIPPIDPSPASTNIQFFTEYSLAEAVTPATVAPRFANAPTTKETPDVLIFIEGSPSWLVAIEAKMYDQPSAKELQLQMKLQRPHLEYIKSKFPETRLIHKALIPQASTTYERAGKSELAHHVVTWDALLEALTVRKKADDYFRAMLRLALDNFDDLSSNQPSQRGIHATGDMIVSLFEQGDTAIRSVGRRYRGIDTVKAEDLPEGRWRSRSYSVSPNEEHGLRWFSVQEFVAAVSAD